MGMEWWQASGWGWGWSDGRLVGGDGDFRITQVDAEEISMSLTSRCRDEIVLSLGGVPLYNTTELFPF